MNLYVMSSSPPPPRPPKPEDQQAATLPNEQDLHALLEEKEAEIKSLKEEIETYKTTISWQNKELQKFNAPNSAAPSAEVEGIAKESLKNMNEDDSSKLEERWKNRFQQLVAYKLEHGHCNVPKSYDDKSLHSWVRTQREAKKDFDSQGKKTSMTQERVEALESIGFQWVVGHQPKDEQWENMFQALLQYKQQHGHTRVSQTENKQLYKWVLNQRARRRLLEQKGPGKAKGMTWPRVERLTAIDFVWDANQRRAPTLDLTQRVVVAAEDWNAGVEPAPAATGEASTVNDTGATQV